MSYFGGGPINLGRINPHNTGANSDNSSTLSDVLRRFKSGASSLGSAAGRPLSWAKRNWWDETPTSYQQASDAYSAASAAAAAEAAAAQAAAHVAASQGSNSSGSGGSGSLRSLLTSLGLGSGSSSNNTGSDTTPSSSPAPAPMPSPSATQGFAPEPSWATSSPAPASVSSSADFDKSFSSTTTADGVVTIGVNFKIVLEEFNGSIDKPVSCMTIDQRTGKAIEVVLSQQDGVNQVDIGPAGTLPSVSSQSNPNPSPQPQSQPSVSAQSQATQSASTPAATTFSQPSQPRTSDYQRLAQKGKPYGWGSRVPHPEHEIDLDQPPSTVGDGKSLYDSICSDGDLSQIGRKYALLENTTAAFQKRYRIREPDGSTSSALDFSTARQQAYIWLDNQLQDPTADKSLLKSFEDNLTHTYLTSKNNGQPVPFIIDSQVELPSVWDQVAEKITNDGDTVSEWVQKRAWELTSRGLSEGEVKSVIKDLINDTDKARSQYSKRFGLSESSELARMAAFDLVNSGISTGKPQISEIDSTLSNIILGIQIEQSERERSTSTSTLASSTSTASNGNTGSDSDTTMYSVELPDGRSVTIDAEQLATLRSRMASQQSQSQTPSFSSQPSSFGANTGFNPSTGIQPSLNTRTGPGRMRFGGVPLPSAMRGSRNVRFV